MRDLIGGIEPNKSLWLLRSHTVVATWEEASLSILSLVFELADPSLISFHVRCWKDDSYGGVGSRKGPACLGVTCSGSWCI